MSVALTGALRSSPSCERNSQAIGVVLADWVQGRQRLLEIGSGTGQHASALICDLQLAQWQTSDMQPDVATIRGWAERSEDAARIVGPETLDVTEPEQWASVAGFDACFSANTLHIMPWSAVQALFYHASEYAGPDCLLMIYGPFHENGKPTSDGNARFDESLRAEKRGMGIRDIAAVRAEAAKNHWLERAHYQMPANNQVLVFALASGQQR